MSSKKKKYELRPLYNAIRKYGAENFWVEEIEKCDEDDVELFEEDDVEIVVEDDESETK